MAKCPKLGKQMSIASSSASSLPVDMISEILLNLPVKSLIRFRCVCNSWLNLIQNRDFIERHLKHNSNSNDDECILVVCNGEDKTKGYLSFHSPETLDRIPSSPILKIPNLKFSSLDVCGSANGLICASDDTNILLCNPSTRELKLLPLSPAHTKMYPEGSEISRKSIGFGFDSHKNDFKVVTFLSQSHVDKDGVYIRSTSLIEIYNLSSNSWKEYELFEEEDYPEWIEPGRRGTLYEGSFYWIVGRDEDICILSYNMSKDEFIYMSLPHEMMFVDNHDELFDDHQNSIRVINDCLAVLVYNEPYICKDMFVMVEIWVMHEFGEVKSFTKDYRIGPIDGMRVPLSIWKNEALLIDSKEGQLVSCALDTHEVTGYNIHASISQTMIYKESLVSLRN